MNKAANVILMSLVVALTFSPSVFAGGTTCSTSACSGSSCAMANDPVGDATLSPNITAAPYQDIVEAQVSKTAGVFSLVMNLVAGIPAQPLMPPQMKLLEWSFRLDTDPTIAPAGFPNDEGGPAPADFYVFVTWDGASFAGYVIDRRPEVTGGDPIITNVPFCINSTGINVSVDAAILDNPSSFGWRVFTQDWNSPFGNDASHTLDIMPAGFHVFLPWPTS